MKNLRMVRAYVDASLRDFCCSLENMQRGRFEDMKADIKWADRNADSALMIYVEELERIYINSLWKGPEYVSERS